MDSLLPDRQATLLKTLLQFNGTASGRDKVFRLAQTLTNLYLYQSRDHLERSRRLQLQSLSSSLGSTRSFLKLGNFLNSFDGALKAFRLDDSLLRFILTTSKLQSTIQTLFDNLLFLNALGLLGLSDKIRARMTSTKTKMSFVSGLLSLWRDLYELIRIVDVETRKAAKRRKSRVSESRCGGGGGGGGDGGVGSGAEEKWVVLERSTSSASSTSRSKRVPSAASDAVDPHGLFHPSLTGVTVKDLDWPKFLAFLWRHHFPLCVDAIKNSVDIVVPAKNVGVIKDVNQGFALLCGLVSSVCGLMTAWNPAYRMTPS